MQLDRTRIAIRQRSVLDSLDLSLRVIAAYARPLAVCLLLGVIPLWLVNHFAIAWMVADRDDPSDFPTRFIYHLVLLTYIQAPLATLFATLYLGQAVFLERPSIRTVVVNVLKMSGRVLVVQILARGVGVVFFLVLTIRRGSNFDNFGEGVALVGLALYTTIFRAAWPFINEIVLLERNPITSNSRKVMTVHRRSRMLHGAGANEVLNRWIVGLIVGVLLGAAFCGSFLFVSGVFFHDWRLSPFLLQYCAPLSLWAVAGFMAVFRFLSYLDLRIRQEGWEVELRLRAEAARLKRKLA